MINSHSTATQRFFDQLLLRLSRKTYIDGVWVGVFSEGRKKEIEILRRVGEALHLIKRYDKYRYKRVLQEIERIWVHLLPYGGAVFARGLKRCLIDPRFVLASSPTILASAIVHEATHGRLMRYNIGYEEQIRSRVEKICMRQELRFALKVPDGEELQQTVKDRLELPPESWSDEAFAEAYRTGEHEIVHVAGIPEWLERALLRFRDFRRKRALRPR
jgi:hypothetical protein